VGRIIVNLVEIYC